MSSIRRAGATMDMGRLGRAVGFPGIDPRGWVSLAIVTATAIDPVDGPLVDIILMPSQVAATARVGAEAAFGGGGQWWPIHPNDEVLVSAPEGDPAAGLVVTRRLWSAADPPPSLVVANPDDVLLQAPDKRNMRVVTTNGHTTLASPDLRLGGEDASHPVPLGDTLVQTIAHGIDQAQLICIGPLSPLKVPLAALVTALGFTPGSVTQPSGDILSSITKTK